MENILYDEFVKENKDIKETERYIEWTPKKWWTEWNEKLYHRQDVWEYALASGEYAYFIPGMGEGSMVSITEKQLTSIELAIKLKSDLTIEDLDPKFNKEEFLSTHEIREVTLDGQELFNNINDYCVYRITFHENTYDVKTHVFDDVFLQKFEAYRKLSSVVQRGIYNEARKIKRKEKIRSDQSQTTGFFVSLLERVINFEKEGSYTNEIK